MPMNAFRVATVSCWLAVPVLVAAPTTKKATVAKPPTAQPSELDRLQLEKLVEEIKKLKLENQALSQPQPAPTNQSIPIWAASIAAVVALLVPQIVAAKQARTDRRKGMRLAVAQFGGNCAAAVHHIQWLTWKPAYDLSLTTADFDAYDNAMHLLFPQLIGSFLTASALNPALFAQMKELNDRIVELDSKIGQLIAEARNTGHEDRIKLTEFHLVVNELWDTLPVKFQAFMNTFS
jgi:hypothetical protein